MRILHLSVAASLVLSAVSLSSCQTASADAQIEKTLPQVCTALATAHAAFTAIATTSGVVKASTVKKEAAAYAGVQTLCADPSHTTVIGAVVLAANALAVVTAALNEAHSG